MSRYGLQIGNLPPITGDRRIIRLLTMGDTAPVSATRHKFRFHCGHFDFCVYFRPIHGYVPTASQVVHNVGNGVFDAYFVGSACRVYVYERKSSQKNGGYGLQLFNAHGSIALDSNDEPMNPLPNLYIPPLGRGGMVQICGADRVAQTAVNMHGNRIAMALNIYTGAYTVFRDAIYFTENGLFYVFGLGEQSYPNVANAPVDFSTPNHYSGLSNQKPTSVGLVNTAHHQF